MTRLLLPVLFIGLLIAGCTAKAPEPIVIDIPDRRVDYQSEVKPILDRRCVVCHSCYNSPCQLKLSSFEGIDRGASKKAVYQASRLRTMDPTRLFIDARTTEEWRQKEFFSVTESTAEPGFNNSLMLQLLNHKIDNPKSQGDYYPEADDLTCAENPAELGAYLKKHPNRGMPFGFPPLKKEEFATVAGWLAQGSQGPTPEQQAELTAIPVQDKPMVDKWEALLNQQDPKYRVTARYLYEHLFLAHITFATGTGSFYELVRSRTPPGQPIDIIPTVRPYDDPGDQSFSYRFRKIHSTIVYKTHMVFALPEGMYKRVFELFIDPDWLEQPHLIGYDPILSANPFTAFAQIPPRSRYQFLLDNAHYIIMTFIRGPVCKGQIALNVIHDHFWVMFMDPDHDLSVKYPGFLRLHGEDLSMPTERGSNYGLFNALSNRHNETAIRYYHARQDFYSAHHLNGLGPEAIWKGNRAEDAPMLTVFRHFDSASVHKGVLGELPRTAWVMDFPLLERIYYSLVAGFDVYGTAGHQLAIRLYMDRLRIEGESYFLNFLPQNQREPLMRSWYENMDFENISYHPANMGTQMSYEREEPKRDFLEHIVKKHITGETNISFDENYLQRGEAYPELPDKYVTTEDLLQGFEAISAPGTAFFQLVDSYAANVAHVRIRLPDNKDVVVSIVIHRWHDNVAFLFSEKDTLNPTRDRADFIKGFVGSYPNYFLDLSVDDLPDFFDLLKNFNDSPEHKARLDRFGINRADDNFWEKYDWFQGRFNHEEPATAGLFDLNRYSPEAR